jgi:hypothetical protein
LQIIAASLDTRKQRRIVRHCNPFGAGAVIPVTRGR